MGPDHNLVVNPEQAKLVKRIYGMFLQGQSPFQIARTLTEEGIPSPGGKDHWNPSNIKSILTNEKYKGDALLQKTFTVDFLTKKKKANEGEIPQYYVKDNHEAIIDPETFEMVQTLMATRKRAGTARARSVFSPARSSAATAAAGTGRRSGKATMPTARSSGSATTNSTERNAPLRRSPRMK